MAGLIPFNWRNSNLTRTNTGTGFEDFYNMLDDFFSDGLMPSRNLMRDSFKLDILNNDNEYLVEAELPGIKKEEIALNTEDENLCITVTRADNDAKNDRNYIHRERRITSMSRRIRLADAKLDAIKAKLEEGVLTITIPKDVKVSSSHKIDIE